MPNTTTSKTAQDPAAPVIPAGTYVADPQRSRLTFRAKAFGLVWVCGSMPVLSGTIQVADGRLRGAGEVSASMVSTGLRARDWHLRTRHYLRTRVHPTIRLSVEDAEIASGRGSAQVIVRGNPTAVDLVLDSAQVSDGTIALTAHGTIDRSPFRMLPPPCGVSRLVHVALTVVATPVEPRSA